MMNNDQNAISLIALKMYEEPCRICGKQVESDDMPNAVFAGYGKNDKGEVTRVAHGSCWESRPVQSEWAYPIND